MKSIVPAVIALAAISVSGADSSPTAAVTGGQVRGVMLGKGGAVFKGIPFARPPVGDLRWREPIPVEPWKGVRGATAFGAICAQNPYFVPNAAEISKEDCLFLKCLDTAVANPIEQAGNCMDSRRGQLRQRQ